MHTTAAVVGGFFRQVLVSRISIDQAGLEALVDLLTLFLPWANASMCVTVIVTAIIVNMLTMSQTPRKMRLIGLVYA
jgi:hypothetical protein